MASTIPIKYKQSGDLGNVENPFIAIILKSTLA